MDPFLRHAQKHRKEIVDFIRDLVECESPSDNPRAVRRFVELYAGRVSDIAKVRVVRAKGYGPHVQLTFDLPGDGKKDGQILVLGHSDTVYPMGTLERMPFRSAKGRLWGPGVLDMKGGLAFFAFAMRAVRDLQVPVRRRVVLQLNSDEEVGSRSSRALTEKEALRSVAVLVVEPGTGLEGKVKTARKGIGDFHLTVRGKAAHAGVDFGAGASAIVEVARQVGAIAALTDLGKGLTVNPGTIGGGTRTNVVAEEAKVGVDVRVARLKDWAPLEKKMRSLKAFDKRCSLEVTGGLNRPPMERTAGVVKLFETARALAADLGVKLEESATGGGSDGNFTAALGVPTLDGLGTVGEGAHAPHESILIDRIADRTALLAKLVAAI